ncbi:MAG: hypothetical protein J5935_03625 [Lachnospiraceae bacterium]|nr:hypothetical protein [Lachnospiraceae bacterium]
MKHSDSLHADLQAYLQKDLYPLHMPGHKRRFSCAGALPFDLDLTEVPGTDDLHEAQDILKASMERTAALFHAKRTWHLVNGSTLGNLAALYAAVPFGGSILCMEGCHRSILHAAELLHLHIEWLIPPVITPFEVAGSLSPSDVRKAFESGRIYHAVVLTSPTYEGVLADVSAIASICREYDVSLIVDQAHGAHLGLFPECGFPESAVTQGADLVIQSTHKTLPALTQTALLHLCSDRIDPDAVEHALDVFETSSPSYLLLLSIDECVRTLQKDGAALFAKWQDALHSFYDRVSSLRHLRVFSPQTQEEVFAADPGKILLYAPMGGEALSQLLRTRYGFEPEKVTAQTVLAMTSCMDTKEALLRFADALLAIDNTL